MLEEGERPLNEGSHGCCPLICMKFDESEPGVVVDDRVGVVVADPCLGTHPVARALGAVASDRVAGPLEARVAGTSMCSRSPGQGHS